MYHILYIIYYISKTQQTSNHVHTSSDMYISPRWIIFVHINISNYFQWLSKCTSSQKMIMTCDIIDMYSMLIIHVAQFLEKFPQQWHCQCMNNASKDIIISFIITLSSVAQYFIRHNNNRGRIKVRLCTLIKVTPKMVCEGKWRVPFASLVHICYRMTFSENNCVFKMKIRLNECIKYSRNFAWKYNGIWIL